MRFIQRLRSEREIDRIVEALEDLPAPSEEVECEPLDRIVCQQIGEGRGRFRAGALL